MHISSPEQNSPIGTESGLSQEVARVPKRMTPSLIFLCSCVALIMTGFGIIVPVFPQRLQALGLGASMLALMEGAFGLGMFLSSTPMGVLADRIGRRPIIFLSLTGFILTNLGLAFVNYPPLFIVFRFIEGILISGLFPAAMSVIGDSMPAEKQGRWIGILTTAQALGIAIGPGIGGFLYQAWGFTSPFLLSAGIALMASLLAFFMLPETLPAQVRERARQQRMQQQDKTLEKNQKRSETRRLLWLFAPYLIMDFGLTFIYPFVLPQYPFFFERVLKFDAAQYGVIISAYGLSLAVFPALLGGLPWPKKRIIIVGTLLFPLLNIALLVVQHYWLLVAASVITGMGSALLLPALATLYLGVTTDENRSQVMGIRGSAISFGILLAPLAQALVGNWLAPQVTFAISVGLSFLLTGIAIFALKTPSESAQ